MDRLVVMIDSAGTAAWTTRLSDWLTVFGVISESVAETVKLEVPLCDGVPASTPAALKVMPEGKVPEAIAQVNGPTPPTEVKVVEYGTLMTAAGSAAGLMTSGRTGVGGRPVAQDSARISSTLQVARERARFNAVIKVLVAQITFVPGVVERRRVTESTAKKLKVLRGRCGKQADFSCRSTMVTGEARECIGYWGGSDNTVIADSVGCI